MPLERTSTEQGCPFCSIDEHRIVWSSPVVIVLLDAFPVSPGHSLVVPRRHVSSWDLLTSDEKAAIITGVDEARAAIAASRPPDGFNIGCNDGVAAGQTVMHFHMHVIPRYAGDVRDARGGVRWVVPAKAAYWKAERE
jgi:diadenosine tetraphosphate (Ap4A) HIT family hydrolase